MQFDDVFHDGSNRALGQTVSRISGLDGFDTEVVTQLSRRLEARVYEAGECIARAGQECDGCLFIDCGVVSLTAGTLASPSENDPSGGVLEAGAVVGDISLLDGSPHQVSAIALTRVEGRWLSRRAFDRLVEMDPRLAGALAVALARNLAERVRRINEKLEWTKSDPPAPVWMDDMVENARRAQQIFAVWSEEEVGQVLRGVARALADSAASLAEDTVTETGMGVVEHKIAKNRFGALGVLASLEGRRSFGLLHDHEQPGVVLVGSPVGVVFGLIPLTNPIATLSFKALICLKSRNALICSVHRNAFNVGIRATAIIRETLGEMGAPMDLVQVVERNGGREATRQLMRHSGVGLTLATGGPEMVRAAYSSGKPAIGVGAGNAPCWISTRANIERAAETIVRSKSFDNGIICGSENNLLVDEQIWDAFFQALDKAGAAIVRPDEVAGFCEAVFESEGGGVRKCLLGKSAAVIAAAAGLRSAPAPQLLVVPVERTSFGSPLLREKLAPVVSAVPVRGVDDAVAVAREILVQIGGIGHTAVVHSDDPDEVRLFGEQVPASRILVNDHASQGCIGLTNQLTPSLTLGCGTFGGSSTTDNVSYRHLLNMRRIVYPKPQVGGVGSSRRTLSLLRSGTFGAALRSRLSARAAATYMLKMSRLENVRSLWRC